MLTGLALLLPPATPGRKEIRIMETPDTVTLHQIFSTLGKRRLNRREIKLTRQLCATSPLQHCTKMNNNWELISFWSDKKNPAVDRHSSNLKSCYKSSLSMKFSSFVNLTPNSQNALKLLDPNQKMFLMFLMFFRPWLTTTDSNTDVNALRHHHLSTLNVPLELQRSGSTTWL